MRALASYSDPMEAIRTKGLRLLVEGDDRIVGFSIERSEGRVFIYTNSSQWCDGAGSGTFSGTSETAAAACYRAEVRPA